MSTGEASVPPPNRRIRLGKVSEKESSDSTSSGSLRPELGKRGMARICTIEGIFFLCLVIGFAAAIVGLFTSEILTFLSPILATIAYPFIGLALGFHKRAAQRERFADNCYYLGFIFTQGGLMLAFLPVTLLGHEITSTKVMQFFGMAIGAALAGLIARTMLIQMGMSVADARESVHDEVELLAQDVARQARKIIGQFEAISAQIIEVPDRFARRLDVQFDGIDTALGRLRQAATQAVEEYDSSRNAIRLSTQAAEGASERALTELGANFAGASEALIGLRAEIANQSNRSGSLIQSATESLGRAIVSLSALGDVATKLPHFEAEIVQLKDAGNAARSATEGLLQELSSATLSIRDTFGSGVREIKEASASAVGELTTAGQHSLRDVSNQAESFGRDLDNATASLKAVLSAFDERLNMLLASQKG
jgi:hypothetical protein